jgi:hypothetical protein
MTNPTGHIRVRLSGWLYPGWRAAFYPKGQSQRLAQTRYFGRRGRRTYHRVSDIHSAFSGQAGQRWPCASRPCSRHASPRLIRRERRWTTAFRGRLGGIFGCSHLSRWRRVQRSNQRGIDADQFAQLCLAAGQANALGSIGKLEERGVSWRRRWEMRRKTG